GCAKPNPGRSGAVSKTVVGVTRPPRVRIPPPPRGAGAHAARGRRRVARGGRPNDRLSQRRGAAVRLPPPTRGPPGGLSRALSPGLLNRAPTGATGPGSGSCSRYDPDVKAVVWLEATFMPTSTSQSSPVSQ